MDIHRINLWVIVLLFCNGCSNQKETLPIIKESLLGMEFTLIPKGSFLMGANEMSNDSSSAPVHKVIISNDFWMGKKEVTQRQWQQIMGDKELHPEKPSPFRNEDPDYPVVSVSYLDVQKFLERLNELSEKYRFRLPTEAEWEYACRAGTATPFYYGNQLSDTLANFNATLASGYSAFGKFTGHPQPVGSYAPNAWGLHDMHGNVWEWVSDWYGPYPKEEVTDPKGPADGTEKIIRGGSWYFGADNATSFKRKTHEPQLWGFSIGFRIVCEKYQ